MRKERKIITQIGSLPYEDVKQAVEYSLKHDIPFLPELPRKGDAMLNYIKHPGRLSCLEEFKKHQFETVKIQCVGPATLMLSGYEEDDAVVRIMHHLEAVMDGLRAEEVILFLDEPALGQAGFNYQDSWTALFQTFEGEISKIPKVNFGVHTCGNMDWDMLFSSPIDIIGFDASKYDLTKYSAYRSGKRIAWGAESLKDIRDFRKGDLITLPCGIGTPLYKGEDCPEKLKLLESMAREVSKGAKQ